MADIVLISGSPSNTSRSATILKNLRERFAQAGFDAAYISVRDLPAEDLLWGKFDSPALKAPVDLVTKAHAVVVGTPVYKAAYTGTLKAFLDLLPQYALRGKVVLPIANGGSIAHLLSIEYALKPLLSVLGASEVLQGVYATDEQVKVGPGGELTIDPTLQTRFDESFEQIVERLRRLPPAAI